MKIVTLDMETYYSTDYSLSKMTTEEYIRDPRFEVIGCSIKHDNGPALFSSARTVEKTLRETIDWDDSLVIAHNMAFDGAILGWRYGLHPKMYACTMSMAQGLGLHNTAGGVGLAKLTTWAQQRGVQIKDKGDEVVRAMGKRFADFSLQELYAYGEYCNTDTNNAYALFKYFLETVRFPLCELPVISECMRLFCDPLLNLEKPTIDALAKTVAERKDKFLARSGVSIEQIRSDDMFATLLTDMGVDPPTKPSPKRVNEDGFAKVVWAFSKTDQEFLDLQESEDDDVAMLVECRLANKSTIEESRTNRFVGIQSRGTLPFPLKYYGAHHSRFAGNEKLNLQNLSRLKPITHASQMAFIDGAVEEVLELDSTTFTTVSGEHQRKTAKGDDNYMQLGLRHSFTAPPGHLLVVSDSSQIEARMLAWMAEQEDLVEDFRAAVDIYSNFASEVYQKQVTKANKPERFTGKVSILQLGFGSGWATLQRALLQGGGGIKVRMMDSEAKAVVARYRQKYSRIPALWKQAEAALDAMIDGSNVQLGRAGVLQVAHPDSVCPFPSIVFPSGMRIQYPNLRKQQKRDKSGKLMFTDYGSPKMEFVYTQMKGRSQVQSYLYGGKCTENFVSGLARFVVTDQWIQIKKRAVKERIFHRSPVVGQVHDELIAVCPEAAAEDLKALMIEEMSKAPPWAAGLPVACEAAIAYRYGDAK